jgi:exopolyphosphatase/guanosine-5'-triphosphate,3'-diphosphate pyrophosphatase
LQVAILLRLAIIFHRGRKKERRLPVTLRANNLKLKLTLPSAWFEVNALTCADLESESQHLQEIGYTLDIIANGD